MLHKIVNLRFYEILKSSSTHCKCINELEYNHKQSVLKQRIFIFLAVIIFVLSCENQAGKTEQFIIQTKYGEIVIELYDNTPKHKSNFMVLANKGYYDGLLFHRVIDDFIIQGGDPDSRNARPDQRLGTGGSDYTLKAEIRPENIHKRGALAAARKGDDMNPDKRSSGSQFYIVTGKVYTNAELDALEERVNTERRMALMDLYIDEQTGLRNQLDEYAANDNQAAIDAVLSDIALQIKQDSIGFKEFYISEARRKIYTTTGGAPVLDDEYTVFGEVTEGMDVVEKIAALPTDEYYRPLYDVKMKIIPKR